MTVKLTLEFATLAELTAFVAKAEGLQAPKPTKGKDPSASSTTGSAPETGAPSPATAPSEPAKPKAREYKDTNLAKLINDAVDAGKGPAVKKMLTELKAFDPADNTKVKGPFIKAEDFDKAEDLLKKIIAEEPLG